jgi:Flp pilus assembly protein TadD
MGDLPGRHSQSQAEPPAPPRQACGAGGFACQLLAILACASCTHEVQLASQAPPHTKTHAVLARQVENAVDFGDADVEARRWRKRLAANASDLDARLALARLYVDRGQPQLAVEHYRLAAELNPDLPGVTLLLAKSLRDLNEPAEALRIIAAYVNRHPKESWELLSLAGILEDEQGLFKPAESAYRAALAIDSAQSSVHNNLGYNLLLQGNAEAAAAEFRKAIEIDPRSVIAHNNQPGHGSDVGQIRQVGAGVRGVAEIGRSGRRA